MTHLKTLALGACVTLTLAACSGNPMTNYSELGYRSNYTATSNQVSQYNVQRIAQAPQRKVIMMEFNRPSAEIFMPLLAQVDMYADDVVKVEFDHSRSQNPGTFGVGSVRICTFDNGDKLYEPLKVYEAGRYYAYTVDKARSTKSLPIDDVLLFYSFEDTNHGKSLVTVRAHYNPPFALASPVINYMFGGAVEDTFASATQKFGGRLIDPDA